MAESKVVFVDGQDGLVLTRVEHDGEISEVELTPAQQMAEMVERILYENFSDLDASIQ